MLLLALLLAASPPDLILHHGKILTVDAKFTIVQAIAIQGGRITALGTNATILNLKGPQTQLTNLHGKTVLPGLIDSHTHALDASLHEFDHEIPEMSTIPDVLAHIRARAKALPAGEWIILRQVFITRLEEQRYPTRAELDSAAPNHPVIFSTGPDASLNTLGLQRNNITKSTSSGAGQPGKVELDPLTGEPTGILRTYASFVKSIPTDRIPTLEEKAARLKLLLADYNSVGITSITDRAATWEHIKVYEYLRDHGGLTCRVFLDYHITDPNRDWQEVEAEIAAVAASPLHKYNNQLWLRGIKVFLDGGMLTGSALMREPWGKSQIYSITDPEYRGMRYIDNERLYQLAKASLSRDLQFTAHVVGDGAIHSLLNAYERVNNDFPIRAQRPNLTHANFMSPEAVEKMAKLGVTADLQPAWLELDGATLAKQFGLARLRYFQPYASLIKAGVTVGGGSDHMQRIGSMRSVNPYNPFWGMWIAMTRQPRWTDQSLHPQERLTREQAIRLYTINNAYLSFEEKEKGSLEVGKLADFAVLEIDILTAPVDEIKSMKVTTTYANGTRVYPR